MRKRWIPIAAVGLAGLLIVALIVIAAFPFGSLKGTIQARLADRLGRPVAIGSIERVDGFGFTPTIRIRDVRIAQPAWAGQGDFVRLASATATFSTWPLLLGRFAPRDIHLDGLNLVLVRRADGTTNWKRGGGGGGGSGRSDLEGLTIVDSRIAYRDAKQDRQIVVAVASDPKTGVRVDGRGTIRGADVTVHAAGPSIATYRGRAWPFTAAIDGPALAMTARGTMDRPLDTDAMTLDVTARADDLKLIDAVIEAGLFRTRAVSLAAHVRHDKPKWVVTDLKGTIGRSDLAGQLSVDKVDGRTRIDGAIAARQLDFDDLSSAEGRAQAAARERATGPRLVPDTRVDLAKIDHTDGRIAFRIGRVVSAEGPSSIVSAQGVMTMDHQRLIVSPVTLRLTQGIVTGRAVVDQRGERRVPVMTFDLTLDDGSVVAIAGGGGDFTGRVQARAKLTGAGDTIRAAIGRSSGSIGFVARDGTLPGRYAEALGFDAGRALLAGNDDVAGLRCVILHLAMTDGRGRVDPLLVDTTDGQTHGTGFVRFPDETLDLRITGAPKPGGLLRLPGSAIMTGTIEHPRLVIPPEVKSIGNIFKAIGRAITGRQGPEAQDADCGALAARALR